MKCISRILASISIPITLFPHCLYRLWFLLVFSYLLQFFKNACVYSPRFDSGVDTLHKVFSVPCFFHLICIWSSLQPHREGDLLLSFFRALLWRATVDSANSLSMDVIRVFPVFAAASNAAVTSPVHMLSSIFASVSLGQIAWSMGLLGQRVNSYVCSILSNTPPEGLCSGVVQTQQHWMRGPFFPELGSQTCQTSLFGGQSFRRKTVSTVALIGALLWASKYIFMF